jgi:hypothetical protein
MGSTDEKTEEKVKKSHTSVSLNKAQYHPTVGKLHKPTITI